MEAVVVLVAGGAMCDGVMKKAAVEGSVMARTVIIAVDMIGYRAFGGVSSQKTALAIFALSFLCVRGPRARNARIFSPRNLSLAIWKVARFFLYILYWNPVHQK